MAFTEEKMNDKIEVINLDTGYPVVQVRTAITTRRDGEVIAKNFHRHVLTPDADLTNEDADVAAIASTVFTDEAKAAYAAQETD